MLKLIVFASLSVVGLFSAAAYAAAEGPMRYTGIAIGQVTVKLDDVFRLENTDFNESDTGYKFFGGYLFNQNFGLEFAYMDGANPEMTLNGGSMEIAPSAFTLEGLGRIPLGKSVALFGKVGIAFYDVDVQSRFFGQSIGFSESGSELVYGAGVSIGLGQNFELRAEWEQFDIDVDFRVVEVSGDVSTLSLGGVYKF